ncbi:MULTISPECIES: hypothetical protein [Photobacterium]|uniref:WalW protein n=1 Tax=Photobacterium halotolerans TaxID=265726 RepID=A0A0F5VDS1_9GAMM|nr:MULTISPECIES: hypothetical protein [Photobacterium]KKD00316.1 hypothetical protein KY46_08730 [Photobacterium halotolerans]UIP30119.1 hypothetical protein LN341_21500 [Photobacterium sp. TLY01]
MDVKLLVVIHAEEEFDWNQGFHSTNTAVTHHHVLIPFMGELIERGAKITLAMDYPFVDSAGGREVIAHCQENGAESVEFAAHLHPWVNPPGIVQDQAVTDFESYPCNLAPELEHEKISRLTERIYAVSGASPVTYLAGRYGYGRWTSEHLRALGYQVDLSISAYCDFSHQQGPDFSDYTNALFVDNTIRHIPHTSSWLSVSRRVEKKANQCPAWCRTVNRNGLSRIFGKLLRLSRHRLSPEGNDLAQLQAITQAQMAIGQDVFVLSFHSPSLVAGMTPYVPTGEDCERLKNTTRRYIDWFQRELNGEVVLAKDMALSQG